MEYGTKRERGTIMGEFSTFLFARPSAAEGIGRILDFGGTLNEYNRSPTGQFADFVALYNDWRAVGFDLWQEMETQKEELERVREIEAK